MIRMFAVFNINKPLHCTSHDVVAKVRKKLSIKKVGHCGTLDPLASGVLPVCAGDATRLIEYFPTDKEYIANVTFGRTTLSWDAEGDMLEEKSASDLTSEVLQAVLPRFQGKILQQIPPHAAVHVKGKKLYEYARRGIAVELPYRETEIYSIELIDLRHSEPGYPIAVLKIHCASGTYIRSIARALGNDTGYGAFLSDLSRTRHGKFCLEQSVDLSDFMEACDPGQYRLDPADFVSFPRLMIPEPSAVKISHGMKLHEGEYQGRVSNHSFYLLEDQNRHVVAVVEREEKGRLKPVKVFHVQ